MLYFKDKPIVEKICTLYFVMIAGRHNFSLTV